MVLYILYQSSTFDNTVRSIEWSLKQQGFYPVVTTHVRRDSDDDYYIVVGAHDIVGKFPKQGQYEVYQFEQLPDDQNTLVGWFAGDIGKKYVEILRNANRIFDYSLVNSHELKSRYDLSVRWLPLGWIDKLHVQPKMGGLPHNQIFFVGSMNPRRREILSEFSEAGLSVLIPTKEVWSDQRAELVSSCKVALNIHYYPNATLETTRIIDLLSVGNGILILSEPSSDPELDKHYENIVVFATRDQLVNSAKYWMTHHDEREAFVNNAMKLFKERTFTYPAPLIKSQQTQEVSDFPEEDGFPFKEAQININHDNTTTLKLSQNPSLENMPPISLITLTRNRSQLFEIALANWRRFKYPMDRVEWVIVDDSPVESSILDLVRNINQVTYIHIPSEQPMTISEKRNIGVSRAKHEIIVHMDDDDYYYPISLYARVKLLLDNREDGVKCVGCKDFGVYHLMDNYSFKMNTNSLAEASMCYFKSFWKDQQFSENIKGEGVPFLRNRRKNVMVLPSDYNFVAVTHNSNYTTTLRSAKTRSGEAMPNAIYKSWDFETQRLMNRIYRKLKR